MTIPIVDASSKKGEDLKELTSVVIAGNAEQSTETVKRSNEITCWYVWSILASIFCCLPFGMIGLVHIILAKSEGERGNVISHRKRLRQAKCWTSWAIATGVLIIVMAIGFTGLGIYLSTMAARYRYAEYYASLQRDYYGPTYASTTDRTPPWFWQPQDNVWEDRPMPTDNILINGQSSTTGVNRMTKELMDVQEPATATTGAAAFETPFNSTTPQNRNTTYYQDDDDWDE